MLDESPLLVFIESNSQPLLGVHDDGPVPGHRLSDGLAGYQSVYLGCSGIAEKSGGRRGTLMIKNLQMAKFSIPSVNRTTLKLINNPAFRFRERR